jgi:ABC-2 type transport system permease protein
VKALAALTKTEARLFVRNPTSMFMALLLPAGLLLLQAYVIPGTREPLAGDAHLRLIDLFVPVAIAIALTSVAVTNYPSTIGAYRESGVLRRLDVTPVGPARVLFAQWIISGLSFAAATALTVALAVLTFGASPPLDIPLVIAIVVAGALTMMAVGSLIAAVAPSAQAAYGIGLLVFMASLFTAGVWTPGPLMSDPMRDAVAFTPLGSMTQQLTAAWYGGAVDGSAFLVMGAWLVLCATVSAKVFRWR